jgi:hypothetical protein
VVQFRVIGLSSRLGGEETPQVHHYRSTDHGSASGRRSDCHNSGQGRSFEVAGSNDQSGNVQNRMENRYERMVNWGKSYRSTQARSYPRS